MLTYGSIFAGVGGFDLGFDAAGMECLWQCEKDKNCRKLLKKKWPNAALYEDATTLKGSVTATVDVICGGSPCQNLSVAGGRAGLAGSRSRLFFEMVRICKQQRNRGGAKFVVWENVDGAFSSNDGRDFACILRAFTGVQVEVPADGWGRSGFVKTPFPTWRWHCAWRVFNAEYFGVPQRRRRVFLVASAGDGSCAEILFEPESLRGDSPPVRCKGQRVASTIAGGSASSSGYRLDADTADNLIPATSKALKASDGGIDREDAHTLIPAIADCLQERDAKGADSNTKNGHLLPIVFNWQAAGDQTTLGADKDVAAALNCMTTQAVAFKASYFTRGKDGAPSDCCPPLTAEADQGDQDPVVHHFRGVRRLTPRECDRLMGWPEDHTSGFKDRVRYRMAGNGVASPITKWLGKRLVLFATNNGS